MPGPKKFNSFGKLGEFLKKQQLEEAGKKMVDSSKNINKGTRTRFGTGQIKTTAPKSSKVVIVQPKEVTLPEFKPYYINNENPNILSSEQQELKDYLVKSGQIDLAKYQRDLANRGINTPASHRRATALAVKTNPRTVISSPEGAFKPQYKSGASEWEGAPLSEWFDLASQDILPHGPNAIWRKWEQPLKDATNSWDVIGQLRGVGAPAPEMSLQQLGDGLHQMSLYLGPNGTMVTPPRYLTNRLNINGAGLPSDAGFKFKQTPFSSEVRSPKKPYTSPLTVIKNKYNAPETNVVSNFIGPDMKPGIYGYHVSTNEWWPLTKRAADSAVGNIDKYSMFSTIGNGYRLSGKIANRHNVIERGVNFEGEPFVVRSNKHPEIYKFNNGPGTDYSGPADWANSGSGSWKVKGYEQGGVILAKSGIHIKKKNRGKFTSWCGGKVTSECIARGKRSSNPAIRKRATFAANARKWKH